MMKRNIYMMLAATIILAASCAHGVDDVVQPGGEQLGGGDTYSVSVGASSEQANTRAVYDGVNYMWSKADKMGFYMVSAEGGSPVVSNARFTSVNTDPSITTDFEGEVNGVDLSGVDPGQLYDYYSYYPYDSNASQVVAFPNVAFNIPSTIELTPDVFPVDYTFMVAKTTSEAGEKPITWLESGSQKYGKRVSFQYKHVFSYLGVYLKVNLMSKPIGKVVVTCTDGSPMWGKAMIDMGTGNINFSDGSNSLTVNISGGLTVSDDKDKGYLWVPVNPALSGKQFRFDFYTTDGFLIDSSDTTTVTGGALEGGMKHKAGFQLPFFIDFSQDASGGGKTFYSFGHTITTNMDTDLKNSGLELEGSATASNRDAFKLPLLSTDVHPDYNTISRNVMVKIEAYYQTAWFWPDNYKKLHYNVASASEYTISDSSSPYFDLNTSYSVHQSADPVFEIGDDRYVTFRCRIPTGLSYQYIKRVWVYPRFDK